MYKDVQQLAFGHLFVVKARMEHDWKAPFGCLFTWHFVEAFFDIHDGFVGVKKLEKLEKWKK